MKTKIGDPGVADTYTILQKIVENNATRCPYIVAIYCTLDGTRPCVYRELVGVMDLWTCDPWKMKKWITAMDKVRFDFPTVVETGVDPSRGLWVRFKDIPVMPYAFKAMPVRELLEYPGWFDMAHSVGLGCGGDLGELICQGSWPRLCDLANAAAKEQFQAEYGEPYVPYYGG